MPQKTRVFFTTDIHGSDVCFRKFLNAGKHFGADVLIIGGDLTGKQLVPIVRRVEADSVLAGHTRWPARVRSWLGMLAGSDSTPTARWTHRGYFSGRTHYFDGEAEVVAFEKSLADQGIYTIRCDKEKEYLLSAHSDAMEMEFVGLMKERLSRWVELADDRLRGQGRRVFVNAGNDDPFQMDEVLDQSRVMQRPEGVVVELDSCLTMISTGFTNLTPWHCPRDIPEDHLREKIDAMAARVPDLTRCVFNFHCPPHDTLLDRAPKLQGKAPTMSCPHDAGRVSLRSELQPQMTGLGVEYAPAGSTSVRDAIHEFQPCAGLHGHIHESRAIDRLGRCVCINPGSEYHEGVLRGALLDFQDGELRNFSLTAG